MSRRGRSRSRTYDYSYSGDRWDRSPESRWQRAGEVLSREAARPPPRRPLRRSGSGSGSTIGTSSGGRSPPPRGGGGGPPPAPEMRPAPKNRVAGGRIQVMHEVDEFHQILREAGPELIICHFSAMCKPCSDITPAFAEMSDVFDNVIFLDVDVHELEPLAKVAKVQAMPTFHFIRNGKKINELVGTDRDKLRLLLEEHSRATPKAVAQEDAAEESSRGIGLGRRYRSDSKSSQNVGLAGRVRSKDGGRAAANESSDDKKKKAKKVLKDKKAKTKAKDKKAKDKAKEKSKDKSKDKKGSTKEKKKSIKSEKSDKGGKAPVKKASTKASKVVTKRASQKSDRSGKAGKDRVFAIKGDKSGRGSGSDRDAKKKRERMRLSSASSTTPTGEEGRKR